MKKSQSAIISSSTDNLADGEHAALHPGLSFLSAAYAEDSPFDSQFPDEVDPEAQEGGPKSSPPLVPPKNEQEVSEPSEEKKEKDLQLSPSQKPALAASADPFEDLQLSLKTGEDAINFFAQHGSSSPIKFVHLIKAESGINFRPYDLQVVKPKDCGTSYYTMSSAGLVHVAPNTASEFTPLAEWMRQSTNFNMLRSIRFYKYYLHTKAFNLWRNNVRYKLYCNQRKKIQSKLFLAKVSVARSEHANGGINFISMPRRILQIKTPSSIS